MLPSRLHCAGSIRDPRLIRQVTRSTLSFSREKLRTRNLFSSACSVLRTTENAWLILPQDSVSILSQGSRPCHSHQNYKNGKTEASPLMSPIRKACGVKQMTNLFPPLGESGRQEGLFLIIMLLHKYWDPGKRMSWISLPFLISLVSHLPSIKEPFNFNSGFLTKEIYLWLVVESVL